LLVAAVVQHGWAVRVELVAMRQAEQLTLLVDPVKVRMML
jgi:hypothetical protein